MGMIINPYTAPAGGGGGGGDPNFANLVFGMHPTGTNGSTTFTNIANSVGGRGNTITPTTAVVSTSNPPFTGAQSAAIGGGKLLSAAHADYAMGTSDYTIRCMFRGSDISTTQVLVDLRSTTGSQLLVLYITGGAIHFIIFTTGEIFYGSLTSNNWFDIMVCRASGVLYLLINGVHTGTGITADAGNYTTGAVTVGAAPDGSSPCLGQIAEVQVYQGIAVQPITGYTPATGPFPNH